ncbi:hypothetical protein HPC62_08810 [Thermoleptolyngbya sichuanensis A183]|uniref:Uncharacterized protein n=1 Tax=Thermoleptolyngbya sichuanensis A183 TaxID=2737172 RepID=A0A6M8BGM8_9CYAN|nr:hypothetical protein [Thermoleptolyngbya sichuanensis]QKD82273.1 hypothetical protein HPC62_08810 [Thermoleptolyngbya sichuanensis A183]
MNILAIIQAKNPAFHQSLQSFLARMERSGSYSVKAIAQYAGLLFLLSQNPGLVAVPTDAIDNVLHQHMEQPEFAQDMALLFGDRAVAEHLPGAGSESGFAKTKALFEREFQTDYGNHAAACELFIKGDRPS